MNGSLRKRKEMVRKLFILLELIYKGLGRLHTGNRLTKIWNNNVAKNAANTSVLPLMKGPLLALWEGGFPTSLDKKTLQTLGLFDGGMLK